MAEITPLHFAFENPDGTVRVSPPLSLRNPLRISPDDLSKFAPGGTGIYGYEPRSVQNPFKEGPQQDAAGGLLFFDNDVKDADFIALTRMLDIGDNKEFAIFSHTSDSPVTDGYLTQLRLINRHGLRYMFEAITDEQYKNFQAQPLTMTETMLAFMQDQRQRYGTFFGDRRLEGKFGGDGDFMREQLSFGIMVENSYSSVYRIWSRAWLVTK